MARPKKDRFLSMPAHPGAREAESLPPSREPETVESLVLALRSLPVADRKRLVEGLLKGMPAEARQELLRGAWAAATTNVVRKKLAQEHEERILAIEREMEDGDGPVLDGGGAVSVVQQDPGGDVRADAGG